MHLNFIFHFDVMAATSVCSVICQYRSNKSERNFELTCFDSISSLNYQHNVMYSDYPVCIQRLVYQLCLHICSKLCRISKYALYHSVSWYNHIVMRIVKSLPIPRPISTSVSLTIFHQLLKNLCFWMRNKWVINLI